MNYVYRFLLIVLLVLGVYTMSYSKHFIPANNPFIQYFGRWDMSDSLHPRHSWPGVYLSAEFNGTSIGIRMKDSINYYNVYIDGKFLKVLHATITGDADYLLADSLENTRHTLWFGKRNIMFDAIFSVSGLLLDEGADLFPPLAKPMRKIEFIGDSFTAAESNEATVQELPWEGRFPVTNIDKGFAAVIARHFQAQYQTTCRSGAGLVCDWQGKRDATMPILFDRTLMEASEPKWDFKQWIPDLAVICLGLNDYSGLKDKDGNVSEEKSTMFRKGYHDFLATLRSVYPHITILAVAAYPEWIQKNVKQVVDEEQQSGNKDIHYTHFDNFPGGYVAYGHPTVATHAKIAGQIIQSIEANKIFAEKN
jgi:Carbohydrate esterase 2 N-terminal